MNKLPLLKLLNYIKYRMLTIIPNPIFSLCLLSSKIRSISMFICNFSQRKIRKNGIELSIVVILAKKWKLKRSFSSSSIPRKMWKRRRRRKLKNKLLFIMNSITRQERNLYRASSTKEKCLQKSRNLLPVLKEEISWVSIARTNSLREVQMMSSPTHRPALSMIRGLLNSQKTTPSLTGRNCKEQKLKMILRKGITQLMISKEINKRFLTRLDKKISVSPIDKTPKHISTEVELSTPSKKKISRKILRKRIHISQKLSLKILNN